MKLHVNGIIIRETDLGENDKLIRIFTDQKGIVSAIVKRAKNIKGKDKSLVQLLAYCKFSLYVGKGGYIVEESEIIELFWGVRQDLCCLSVAQYLCELCTAWAPDENNSNELLKLLLNTLFYLSNKSKDIEILKAIFEFRGSSLCGYMPRLDGCFRCRKYEINDARFFIKNGIIICDKCMFPENKEYGYKLNLGILAALRYIIYSENKKLFSFKLSSSGKHILCDICEKYVLEHLGGSFKSLDFYKSIVNR